MVIEIPCEHVWREISNYLDGDVAPGLREQMEQHFRGCHRCRAVLDGTRNVVALIADESLFVISAAFSERLYSKWRAHLAQR